MPKVFVSYSWTSPAHQEWVIDLATQLRENGADVILDKWDLREGQDAVTFMEQMVTDPEVTKVIMVFDRAYAEKADNRAGGVGTEAQIISAEVYARTDQTKFVGVASELDAEGKPFRPAYYRSRIYIDLSDSDIYASNFEQLLRWAYDKPLHIKPSLGKPPEFLKDDAISLGTTARARRAKENLRNNTLDASAALADYLDVLANGLENFRIDKSKDGEFDDLVVANVDAFLPYRNEYIEIVRIAARFWRSEFTDVLRRFFEKIACYMFRPPDVMQWSDWDCDNFYFIDHELFLYTIALLLTEERFEAVGHLLGTEFYLGASAENRREPMADFTVFRNYMKSLEHRNKRLELRRLSLRADMLEQRSHVSGVPFLALMQADCVLFLRASAGLHEENLRSDWWPDTLLYTGRLHGPFEIFARSQSNSYLARVLPVLGVKSKVELEEVLTRLAKNDRLPRWQFGRVDPAELLNWDKLATKP